VGLRQHVNVEILFRFCSY